MAIPLTNKELQAAIAQTKQEIDQVKHQIKEATDPQEERRLQHKPKELQYLQLWHIEQLERQDKS